MRATPRISTFHPRASVTRWKAGYADTIRALEQQPWIGEFGLLDSVILHEPKPGAEPAAEMQPGKPAPAQPPQKLAAE